MDLSARSETESVQEDMSETTDRPIRPHNLIDHIARQFDELGLSTYIISTYEPEKERNRLYKQSVRRGYKWRFSTGSRAVYIKQKGK